MKVAVFSTKPYDREFLSDANSRAGSPHDLAYHEAHLNSATAALAQGAECVCAFVNDRLDRPTLAFLHANNVRLVALRSAGFNHVDLDTARYSR